MYLGAKNGFQFNFQDMRERNRIRIDAPAEFSRNKPVDAVALNLAWSLEKKLSGEITTRILRLQGHFFGAFLMSIVINLFSFLRMNCHLYLP